MFYARTGQVWLREMEERRYSRTICLVYICRNRKCFIGDIRFSNPRFPIPLICINRVLRFLVYHVGGDGNFLRWLIYKESLSYDCIIYELDNRRFTLNQKNQVGFEPWGKDFAQLFEFVLCDGFDYFVGLCVAVNWETKGRSLGVQFYIHLNSSCQLCLFFILLKLVIILKSENSCVYIHLLLH